MSASTGSSAGEMTCKRHPKVETRLGCGRCETPICPKCLVMTDVGARCPDCAPRRKMPQYELGPLYLLRGLAASLISGAVLGAAWGLLFYDFLGFFMIFLGLGLGYAAAEAVSWATNGKSGTALQIIVAIGVVAAYATRNIVYGVALFPDGDFYGYLVVIIAAVVAVNRLRS
jgi:hypothetical protein